MARSHKRKTEAPQIDETPADSQPEATTSGLSDLIGDAISDDAPSSPDATALDDLALRLDDERPPIEPARASTARSAPIRDPEPAKRGRGRPRKTEGRTQRLTRAELAAQLDATEAELRTFRNAQDGATADPAAIERLAKTVEVLSVLLFGAVAQTRGPHWALSPTEAEAIGKTTAHAGASYAADLERTLPWLAPVMALSMAVGVRMVQDAALVRQFGTRDNTTT